MPYCLDSLWASLPLRLDGAMPASTRCFSWMWPHYCAYSASDLFVSWNRAGYACCRPAKTFSVRNLLETYELLVAEKTLGLIDCHFEECWSLPLGSTSSLPCVCLPVNCCSFSFMLAWVCPVSQNFIFWVDAGLPLLSKECKFFLARPFC